MPEVAKDITSAPNGALRTGSRGFDHRILEVLRRVGNGDLENRLELRYAEDHPVGALTLSVNAMIDSLVDARQRSETLLTRAAG